MRQKLDLPEERHSVGVALLDENLAAHSALAATQLEELLVARDGIRDIRNAVFESWDAASEFENAG
jgi:hypothetical protein